MSSPRDKTDSLETNSSPALRNILILFFLLVILILLLLYLYKKLNRDTDGQYTVRRMVYKEGGVRDRVRGGVRIVETRLGRRLWLLSEEREGGGQEEDRDLEGGNERGESEGEEVNEGSEGDDSSDDYSSMDLRERVNAREETKEGRTESEGTMENEEKRQEEKKDEAREDGEVQVEVEGGEGSGGGGLLIDLNQFSGSALWSEEKSENQGNDVTAL